MSQVTNKKRALTWSTVKLENVVTRLTNGYVGPTRELYQNDGVPYLLARHVKSNRLTFDGKTFVTKEFNEKNKKSILKAGDVLLVQSGHIGESAVVPPKHEGHNCHAMIVITPKREKLDSGFLSWYFSSKAAQSAFQKIQTGITLKHLNCRDIRELIIPLPPLEEQHRIAAILDKADAIRRKRAEAIRLTEELLRAAFLDMFGDPVTNPKGWETKPLGKVASVNRGKFTPRPRNDPRYYDGVYPFIQTGDIASANGYLTEYSQTLNDLGIEVSRSFKPGTVVIAIVGATIGETAILAKPMYCPDSIIGIEPGNDLCSEYLEYSLRWWKPVFRAMAPETARANINLETVRPLKLALPPIEMQLAFQKVYRKILTEKHQEKLSLCDNLFNSLLHRAFRGEL